MGNIKNGGGEKEDLNCAEVLHIQLVVIVVRRKSLFGDVRNKRATTPLCLTTRESVVKLGRMVALGASKHTNKLLVVGDANELEIFLA